jgi:hypothetical protein
VKWTRPTGYPGLSVEVECVLFIGRHAFGRRKEICLWMMLATSNGLFLSAEGPGVRAILKTSAFLSDLSKVVVVISGGWFQSSADFICSTDFSKST